jgi:alkylation response protein AidB-like acyl-CoA dehydrogenase
VTENHPLSMFYRQVRMARLYDGPDEVHKMVVARGILGRCDTKRRGTTATPGSL